MNLFKLSEPIAITMWDFSWLERRWPGAGYEDWEVALGQLVERGYKAVRIDAYPHLVAENPYGVHRLKPAWSVQSWGAPVEVAVTVLPALIEFLGRCKAHGVHVALSTWWREDSADLRKRILCPEDLAAVWIDTLRQIEAAHLLDTILYLDFSNEWAIRDWTPFFFANDRSWGGAASQDWISRAVARLRESYPDLSVTFSSTEPLPENDLARRVGLDLLEPHLWMASCSDFYERVGYHYNRFSECDYDALAQHGERLYRWRPEHWQAMLHAGIEQLVRASDAAGLPLVTTECWGVVDYKDRAGLDWGWVSELCEFGTLSAVRTGRWAAIATSNFCGPQFVGMWRDVSWHQRLTAAIRNGKLPHALKKIDGHKQHSDKTSDKD